MPTITLEIPTDVKEKLGIGSKISYEFLITKTIGKEYLSPDLRFTEYSKMKENHKNEYDKLENIDKSELLNI